MGTVARVNNSGNGLGITDARTKLNELVDVVNTLTTATAPVPAVSTIEDDDGGVYVTDIRMKLNEVAQVLNAFDGATVANISHIGSAGNGVAETDVRSVLNKLIDAINALPVGSEQPRLDADFKNGVFALRGVSKTAADIFDPSLDWWLGFPGPDQLADIVPGTGLTTGPTNTGFSPHGVPFLLADAFAAAVAGGGLCIVGECIVSSSAPLANFNSGGAYAALASYPDYTPLLDVSMAKTATGSLVQFGANFSHYSDGEEFSSPAHFKFAMNLDIATATWTGAINGSPLASFTDSSGNFAACNRFAVGCSAGGDTDVAVTSTIPWYKIFAGGKTQAQLNSLSSF